MSDVLELALSLFVVSHAVGILMVDIVAVVMIGYVTLEKLLDTRRQ
jgi:hypothetical protein